MNKEGYKYLLDYVMCLIERKERIAYGWGTLFKKDNDKITTEQRSRYIREMNQIQDKIEEVISIVKEGLEEGE